MKRLLLFFTALLFMSFGLEAQRTVSGTVTAQDGTPLIGATVWVKDMMTGTVTDYDGKYSLEVPEGATALVFSYVGYASQEVPLGASNVIDVVMAAGESLDAVIVVGSRSGGRTKLTTAVPVDVIGAKALQANPPAPLTQMLQYSAPSFHSTPQTISDGTDHIDPATLRGLGPDQTLVLLNGKRRHSSSLLNVNGTVGRGTVGTDLNTIPAAAIERIEILRDGAAAQYGSDAIAGVMNIVLKKSTNKATINVETGTNLPNFMGGPARAQGVVPDSLVPTFRRDGQSYKVSTNFGFDVGKKGWVNVTGEYYNRASTNRSGNYTGNPYPEGYDNALPVEDFYALLQANEGFVEHQVMEIGNSAVRNASAFINAGFPLGNSGAELYATYGVNYRNGVAHGFYRFPAQQVKVVPQLYPHGFSPQIHSDIFDNSFIVGVRGEIGGWQADFSQTHGANKFLFTIKNSNNASLGTASPTSAYAGGFSYSQELTNVDFAREFDFGIPVNVALGGVFRLENYQIFPGEEASYVAGGAQNVWMINGDTTYVAGAAGIQVFPGFQPQNALNKNRNSVSAYVDLEFDLTDALLLAVAGRYENYNDFGDDFNWKAALRYSITDNFSVRGSYSTGFRAPSLHQVYFNNLSTQFVDVNGEQVAIQVGTFNNESSVAKGFGIEPLKPETSTNLALGMAGQFGNFTLTLDAYKIDIQDRIVISGRFKPETILQINGTDTLYAGDILTPRGAGAAQFFTNAVSTSTKGIDFVLGYNMAAGDGNLNFSLVGNLTKTEVAKDANGTPIINTSPLLEGLENTVFNREEVSRLEVAQPQSKISLSVQYDLGPLSILLRATRFGQVQYIHPSETTDPKDWLTNDFTGEAESRDQTFSPKIVPDVEFSYGISPNLRLAVGMRNFTNTYPDMHQHSSNVSSGRFLFSRRVQQFGVQGAFLYTRLTGTF